MRPQPISDCPEPVEGLSFIWDLVRSSQKRTALRQAQGIRNRPKAVPNGFSLVELMVVIFIIGLLATVVLINVLPSQDRAMRVKAQSDIATLGQAMEMYRLDNLAYPGAGEGLAALKAPPASLSLPQNYRAGGYVKDVPNDPWGRPYQYQSPGRSGAAFDIFSLGADGKPGGDDNDADIYAESN